MNKNKWFMNGGRGSGQTLRKITEVYENKIAELEHKLEQTEKDLADYQFNYPTIKELEKENAELKLKLEALEGQTPWKDIKDKSELIKENAELKEYNKYLKRQRQGGIQKQYNKVAIIKQRDEQLTKAKEIIREFIEWANWQGNSKCPSFKSIQDKAEQFISEVEK